MNCDLKFSFSLKIDKYDCINFKNSTLHSKKYMKLKDNHGDFPGGTVVKNPPAIVRDMGLSPGPGRSDMPRSS